MSEDMNGWGPRAWDALRDDISDLRLRIAALEDAVKKLVGRPPDAPPPSEQEIKVGGVGLGTWIGLAATIVVPIVVAILMTQGGGP